MMMDIVNLWYWNLDAMIQSGGMMWCGMHLKNIRNVGLEKNMFRPGLINWGALCQLSAVRSAVSFFVRVALDLLLWLWLSFCCGLLTHLWLSFCFELLTHLWLSFCFGLLTHLWLRFWFRTCRDLSFLWQPHNKPKDFNISIAKQQRT